MSIGDHLLHSEETEAYIQKRLYKYSIKPSARRRVQYYAGIGSRNTPEYILQYMSQLAIFLAEQDYVLRSGGASGADEAFEKPVWVKKREVYLPWRHFNKRTSPLHAPTNVAKELAYGYHPNPGALNETTIKFMGRNAHQILGPHLDTPVQFVVAYTPKGAMVGGTGTALRVAQAYGIPIFNFGNMQLIALEKGIRSFVEKQEFYTAENFPFKNE